VQVPCSIMSGTDRRHCESRPIARAFRNRSVWRPRSSGRAARPKTWIDWRTGRRPGGMIAGPIRFSWMNWWNHANQERHRHREDRRHHAGPDGGHPPTDGAGPIARPSRWSGVPTVSATRQANRPSRPGVDIGRTCEMTKATGLPLFDLPMGWQPPLARQRDRETSQEGAYAAVTSGKLARQAEAVAQAVHRWPGRTTAELADLMQCDRYCPSRRCPSLAEAGRIRRGTKRRCTITNMSCFTWWPAPGGSQ